MIIVPSLLMLLVATAALNSHGQTRSAISPRTSSTLDPWVVMPRPTLSSVDRLFVSEAVIGGATNSSIANLAVQKGRNASVSAFARSLIIDLERDNARLIAIARQAGIAPPPPAPATADLDYARLSRMVPREFDAAFIDVQIRALRAATSLYERQIVTGSEEGLKDFAARALPTMQQNLSRAQELALTVASATSADRSSRLAKERRGASDRRSAAPARRTSPATPGVQPQ